MYRAVFSRRARKAFLDLPPDDARRVKTAIEGLKRELRPRGTIKLDNAPVAQYRRRVGNYRILFDIDDRTETLELLDIRKRDEHTYR